MFWSTPEGLYEMSGEASRTGGGSEGVSVARFTFIFIFLSFLLW